MTRAAIFVLLAVCSCNRLDQARAKTTASRLESKHLAEVRRAADELEKSCPSTSIDDPAVVAIEVSCKDERGTMLIRGERKSIRNDGFFEIGVGKDVDAGMSANETTEETVRVPSTIATNANDLCIHRSTVSICVAYRD